MALTITAAEMDAAASIVQAGGFAPAIAALQAAVKAKFGDLPADAIAAEDLLDLASKIPSLAVLGDVSALIKLLMIIGSLSTPYPNGGVIGAFMDSIEGIHRPVANADGSDLTQ